MNKIISGLCIATLAVGMPLGCAIAASDSGNLKQTQASISVDSSLVSVMKTCSYKLWNVVPTDASKSPSGTSQASASCYSGQCSIISSAAGGGWYVYYNTGSNSEGGSAPCSTNTYRIDIIDGNNNTYTICNPNVLGSTYSPTQNGLPVCTGVIRQHTDGTIYYDHQGDSCTMVTNGSCAAQ